MTKCLHGYGQCKNEAKKNFLYCQYHLDRDYEDCTFLAYCGELEK